MATNDFLPFCETTTGSNLLTQSEYNLDPQRPIGNQPGVARSKLVNKALRQSAWIASQVAKFISDRTTLDMLDNQNETDAQTAMVLAWPAVIPPPTNTFYQGFHDSSVTWDVAGVSGFVDPTPTGAATLTSRVASGLTVTTAAGNLPGITFTPASASAVYQVTASVALYITGGGDGSGFLRLSDGTQVLSSVSMIVYRTAAGVNNNMGQTLTGVFAPGVATPVTVKLQVANDNGTNTTSIFGVSASTFIDWTVVRIK